MSPFTSTRRGRRPDARISIGGDGTNHALINALADLNARYPDAPRTIYGNVPIGTGATARAAMASRSTIRPPPPAGSPLRNQPPPILARSAWARTPAAMLMTSIL
ncbi:MAG: hypothetical protein IPK19_16690 [Chloroflexi bacterium]|nr:hypothetical protein [Chloroflexota bacterium]